MKYPLLLPAVMLFASNPVAALYKCTDAEGNVTFSQTACAADDKVSEIKVQGSRIKVDPRACELATMFAEDVATRMRRDGDYSRELDRYGGTYNAKPAITGVVSYVYSFRLNEEAAPKRIASLTASKCRNGGFGRIAFDDLPVDEYYYFDELRQVWLKKDETFYPDSRMPTRAPVSPDTPPGSTEPAFTAARSTADRRDCERAQSSLQELDERMRSGYTGSEGERLREKRRTLRDRINETCQ